MECPICKTGVLYLRGEYKGVLERDLDHSGVSSDAVMIATGDVDEWILCCDSCDILSNYKQTDKVIVVEVDGEDKYFVRVRETATPKGVEILA